MQKHRYSIISSAMASKVKGTSRQGLLDRSRHGLAGGLIGQRAQILDTHHIGVGPHIPNAPARLGI